MSDDVEKVNHYASVILRMLTGDDGPARDEFARLDWEGVGAVLGLYRETTGSDRTAIIGAFGQIVEDKAQQPWIIAQIIDLVSSLDLTQVEPCIERLARRAVARKDPVRGALANYLTYRRLQAGARESVAAGVRARAVATG